MFDVKCISARSCVCHTRLSVLHADWLQNYFNAIKVDKTERAFTDISYAIILEKYSNEYFQEEIFSLGRQKFKIRSTFSVAITNENRFKYIGVIYFVSRKYTVHWWKWTFLRTSKLFLSTKQEHPLMKDISISCIFKGLSFPLKVTVNTKPRTLISFYVIGTGRWYTAILLPCAYKITLSHLFQNQYKRRSQGLVLKLTIAWSLSCLWEHVLSLKKPCLQEENWRINIVSELSTTWKYDYCLFLHTANHPFQNLRGNCTTVLQSTITKLGISRKKRRTWTSNSYVTADILVP